MGRTGWGAEVCWLCGGQHSGPAAPPTHCGTRSEGVSQLQVFLILCLLLSFLQGLPFFSSTFPFIYVCFSLSSSFKIAWKKGNGMLIIMTVMLKKLALYLGLTVISFLIYSGRYHILLEKPMAVKEEDCRTIYEVTQKAGVILAVCHVLR